MILRNSYRLRVSNVELLPKWKGLMGGSMHQQFCLRGDSWDAILMVSMLVLYSDDPSSNPA